MQAVGTTGWARPAGALDARAPELARTRCPSPPGHPMMSERIEMLPMAALSLKYAIGSASSLTARA